MGYYINLGQQLGNYRLIKLLGQGGFADVYLGEHIYLKTPAAIKVLQTRLVNDDLEGFLNEARTIARLEHPHIVRVLEFGVEGYTPFLVMGYAPNGTLRQRHPRGTRLSMATVLAYIKQVAEALQYAHDERLIHRDIKPENILLGRRNEVLLSDFGIALIAQSSRFQSTQEVIGTVAYMAPEQIQGKPRPASDQYALGIVAYEWLSGNRPFNGSYTEIAIQHAIAPPPSLREMVPEIPLSVEQVVMIALAKDPHQRFPSVQAFANAFEESCLKVTSFNRSTTFVPLQPTIPASPWLNTSTSAVLASTSAKPHSIPPAPALKNKPKNPSLSYFAIVLGIIGLAAGLYFLVGGGHPARANAALGICAVLLIGGIVGIFMTRSKATTR